MTSFVLKIIGIISMLCDHTSDAIIGGYSFLNIIGRIAFPIFAFQATIGYVNTKDLKKYIIRLLAFAIIAQIPFMLFQTTFTNNYSLNVFFTFLLGICTLFLYDKCKNKFLGFFIVIIVSIIALIIKADYGPFGILIIFLFYYFKDNKIKMIFPFIILCILKYVPNFIDSPILYKEYMKLCIATASSIIFILLYNNKQGPKLKYFFYIFYPLHLLILWAIHLLIK